MTHTKSLAPGRAEGAQAAQLRTSGRFARRAWTMLLALATSMGFIFLNAGSASALNYDDLIGTNFLRSWQTGRCLDSNANGDVYTLPCQQGNQYQMWTLRYRYSSLGWDFVRIQNVATGRILYSWGSGEYNDGPLILRTGTVAEFGQTFDWAGWGKGWDNVQLTTSHRYGECLDSNYAGNAYMTTCGNNDYQHWKLGY